MNVSIATVASDLGATVPRLLAIIAVLALFSTRGIPRSRPAASSGDPA